MLKGIHPLISADLLYILAAMGHGDELALVDHNFPSTSTGRPVVRMVGADVLSAGEAVLTLFPIDTFVAEPVIRMEVVGAPGELPGVQKEFLDLCERVEGRSVGMGSLSRETFYVRSGRVFAVIATSEVRSYGCSILTKGVINTGLGG